MTLTKLYPFYTRCHELTHYRGFYHGKLQRNSQAGQSTILKTLHSELPCIVRMKALARSYACWPTIARDVLCLPGQQTRPENWKESMRQ